MPKSAVVDASVLVSAFLFPASVPGRVVQSARQGKFVLHLSPLLLDETRYALLSTRLREIYGYADAAVLAWCMELAEIGRLFAGPLPEIGLVCRDPMTTTSSRPLSPLALKLSSPATKICWR